MVEFTSALEFTFAIKQDMTIAMPIFLCYKVQYH